MTDKPVPDYIERLKAEADELGGRHARLSAFLCTPTFEKMDAAECRRLIKQEWIMAQYQEILTERLVAAGHLAAGTTP